MKDRRRRDAAVLVAEGGDTGGSGGFGGGGGGGGGERGKLSLSLYLSPSRTWVFIYVVLLSFVAFSSFRIFGVNIHPMLMSSGKTPIINAVTTKHPVLRRDFNALTSGDIDSLDIKTAVAFPDQVLLFLKSPNLLRRSDILCLYYNTSVTSSLVKPELSLSPITSPAHHFMVRCPHLPQNFSISLSPKLPPLYPHSWDHLTYAALLDWDNSTIVFAKGFSLRSARLSDPSHFVCVFEWRFSSKKYIRSRAISAAQEIIRCKTPPRIILNLFEEPDEDPPLVSVKVKGEPTTLPSIASPKILPGSSSVKRKEHSLCVCTMLRNQARVLQEWIIYHSHIGVDRWFIYDNDSDDDIEQVVESLSSIMNYNISLHSWPWVKSQEAGFAHCALRARDQCEWIGFIDVDEFFYLPSSNTLKEVLRNYSSMPWVGELRTACYSFGPSGRKTIPLEGVTVGYTCRMNSPERHKSIIRSEALHLSLMNVVHHFHLKNEMHSVDVEKGVMVINHYKYQVWEVFKQKFHRRVATYVADWQDKENAGSKDRVPGLGTKAVEPPDWPSRFCQVNDTRLRDRVLANFTDPNSGLLPW